MANINFVWPDDDDPIFSAAFVVSSPIQRKKPSTDVVDRVAAAEPKPSTDDEREEGA